MIEFDPHAYNITVSRRVLDGEMLYHARVLEMPDVLGIGETYAEAYEVAIDAISTLRQMSVDEGSSFPAPNSSNDSTASGRITLRLEPSIHRRAVIVADLEKVSLNTFIGNALLERIVHAELGARPSAMWSASAFRDIRVFAEACSSALATGFRPWLTSDTLSGPILLDRSTAPGTLSHDMSGEPLVSTSSTNQTYVFLRSY